MKPKLRVKSEDGVFIIHAPTHHYHVRFDQTERAWQISYLDLHTQKSGVKYKRTIDEALEWIHEVHVPTKLKEWFL